MSVPEETVKPKTGDKKAKKDKKDQKAKKDKKKAKPAEPDDGLPHVHRIATARCVVPTPKHFKLRSLGDNNVITEVPKSALSLVEGLIRDVTEVRTCVLYAWACHSVCLANAAYAFGL